MLRIICAGAIRKSMDNAIKKMSIAEEHAWLCHADGSECDGGATCTAHPGRLALYQKVGALQPGQTVLWLEDMSGPETGPRAPETVSGIVKAVLPDGRVIVDEGWEQPKTLLPRWIDEAFTADEIGTMGEAP
jgi:hypothetical protein